MLLFSIVFIPTVYHKAEYLPNTDEAAELSVLGFDALCDSNKNSIGSSL